MVHGTTPPSPDGVPLLGNALAFSREPFRALERWASLGDVVKISFPGETAYLVTDPDLIESVLVERHASFTLSRQQREAFSDVEENAVTATTGSRWRRLRRALQPAFTAEGVAAYGTRMARRTASHVDGWEDGETIDLHREMRLLTVRIMGDTLLGVDTTGDESVLMDAADALVARSDPRRPGQLLPNWVPTPTDRRFRRRVEALDAYVEAVLETTAGDDIEARSESGADRSESGADRSELDDERPESDDERPATEGPEPADVRSVLLAADERGDLSTEEVRDNLVAVLLGGHDSSAVTLTYAWYELSRHPTVRKSLFEEVQTVCGPTLPDTPDVPKLEWTRAVVSETLRLYPPAWATPRETTETVTLGGYEIPVGAQVLCPQWVLHRDERFWDDPETFDPTRWFDEDLSRPEYAYFPFSGGPRHCIGMRFARLELALVVATTIQRVDLDVRTDGTLSFMPALTLRPTVDVEATVRKRSHDVG